MVRHGLINDQISPTKAETNVSPTHQMTHTRVGAMFLNGFWSPKNPAETVTTNKPSATSLSATRVARPAMMRPMENADKLTRG